MAEKRSEIPVKKKDFSVLDTEFDSIRERFDSEMSKMEEEMNKFRADLLDKESSFFTRNTSQAGGGGLGNTRRVQSARTSSSRKLVNGKEVFNDSSTFESLANTTDSLSASGLGSHRNWLQGLDSPLIQPTGNEESGQKELKLRFDVSQYSPEEIVVKTVDNKLLVQAKHEEQTDGKSVFREYNREFLLPAGTDPDHIRSSLSKDGILTVEAPLPQPSLTQESKKQ